VHHQIEQNTDEWLALRAGKITGSDAAKIMANYGKAFGEPAKKLAITLAIERLTGRPAGETYSNEHMARGHEQEPIARQLYEAEVFCDVEAGGFFDNGTTGCSPDGLADDGLIEIKCVLPHVHFPRIKTGTFDPTYRWQLAHNLRESGCEWIDYVSYSSGFTEAKQLFICRVPRDEFEQEFAQMAERYGDFEALVQDAMRVAA
jgi:hypothetical protein